MSDCEAFCRLLTARFSPYGSISTAQAARLCAHWELLCRWNKALNLTRVTNLEEAVERHYCESLFLSIHLGEGARSVLDVGAGGGFPGIPLAVFRPEFAVTLLESHQRKAVFLREATRDLSNVRVDARRAEELEPGGWNWVISRAVRWPDVVPLAGEGVALLLGEEDAAEVSGQKEFLWQAPVPLPWGKRRVLVIGRRVVL